LRADDSGYEQRDRDKDADDGKKKKDGNVILRHKPLETVGNESEIE
jgi:hypothetical protein